MVDSIDMVNIQKTDGYLKLLVDTSLQDGQGWLGKHGGHGRHDGQHWHGGQHEHGVQHGQWQWTMDNDMSLDIPIADTGLSFLFSLVKVQ